MYTYRQFSLLEKRDGINISTKFEGKRIQKAADEGLINRHGKRPSEKVKTALQDRRQKYYSRK